MIKGFQELVVWQKAHKLALELCRLTNLFPRREQFGLTSRLRRAACLILSNLAEGYRRRSTKESLLRFLAVAGSVEELRYFLTFTSDLRYLSQDRLKPEFTSTVQMIAALAGLVTGQVNSFVSCPMLLNPGYGIPITSREGRMR